MESFHWYYTFYISPPNVEHNVEICWLGLIYRNRESITYASLWLPCFPSLIHTSIPKPCPSPLLGIHGWLLFLCTSISNKGLIYLFFFFHLPQPFPQCYLHLLFLMINDVPLHLFTKLQLHSLEATIGSTFLSQFVPFFSQI